MGNGRQFQRSFAMRRGSGSTVSVEQPDSEVLVKTQPLG